MNLKTIYIALAILIIEGAEGCKRQKIEEKESIYTSVPIKIDWSKSQLPENYSDIVSIYFYPQDGSAPYKKIASNIDSTTMSLPEGLYSVLVFNDAIENITSLDFQNEKRLSLFSCEVLAEEIDNISQYFTPTSSDFIALNHARLAAWRGDKFRVIPPAKCQYHNYLDSTKSYSLVQDTLFAVPTPMTAITEVVVAIENLNSAAKIEAILEGTAKGALFEDNTRIAPSPKVILYGFTFTSATFNEGSSKDGVIKYTLNTFGKNPQDGAHYTLKLIATLNSGDLIEVSRDVSEQVEESEDFYLKILLTSDSLGLTLPESNATGFGVESWGTVNHLEL